MYKARGRLFVSGGKSDPGLNAEEVASDGPDVWRHPLGMHDARSGGHPVNLARVDGLHLTQTVSVENLSID
ncbi:hypothetical protein AJ87_38965 [Rhizobium yanglingense]|nr:hypothetical protein AJ87_38965 [Rhizobium yanglingense]